jgi:hypothetical protein
MMISQCVLYQSNRSKKCIPFEVVCLLIQSQKYPPTPFFNADLMVLQQVLAAVGLLIYVKWMNLGTDKAALETSSI